MTMTKAKAVDTAKGISAYASAYKEVYEFTVDLEELMRMKQQEIADAYGVHVNWVSVKPNSDKGFIYTVDLSKTKA